MKKKFVAIDADNQEFYDATSGKFVRKFNSGCLMDYKKIFTDKNVKFITVDEKTTNIYLSKKRKFVCEICKQKTPVKCEGSEPNTCADCMPLSNECDRGKYGDN